MIEKRGLDTEMVGLGPDVSDQNIGIRKRSQMVESSNVENSTDTTKLTAAKAGTEEHITEASNTEATVIEASATEPITEELVPEAPEEPDEEPTTTGTDVQVARRDWLYLYNISTEKIEKRKHED